MRTPLTILFVHCFLCLGARADTKLRLPHIFGDQMVLQREKPVHVWGWADRDQTVTVSFAGQDKSAKTNAGGKWHVTFDAMDANSEGRSLTVRAGGETLAFDDVLVGDVWLCGGQSNMEMRLRGARDADVEIPLRPLSRHPFHSHRTGRRSGAKG